VPSESHPLCCRCRSPPSTSRLSSPAWTRDRLPVARPVARPSYLLRPRCLHTSPYRLSSGPEYLRRPPRLPRLAPGNLASVLSSSRTPVMLLFARPCFWLADDPARVTSHAGRQKHLVCAFSAPVPFSYSLPAGRRQSCLRRAVRWASRTHFRPSHVRLLCRGAVLECSRQAPAPVHLLFLPPRQRSVLYTRHPAALPPLCAALLVRHQRGNRALSHSTFQHRFFAFFPATAAAHILTGSLVPAAVSFHRTASRIVPCLARAPQTCHSSIHRSMGVSPARFDSTVGLSE